MVMGANMGTTVTNTIVSIGSAREPNGFRRAFAAATVHDMFNFLSILIFLPTEILFKPLQTSAGMLADLFRDHSITVPGFNPIELLVEPVVSIPMVIVQPLSPMLAGSLLFVLGFLAIVSAVILLAHRLKIALTGRTKEVLDAALGRGPLVGIGAGVVVTVAVQSSSTTTSLIVPLAGAGKISLSQVYPFTLGANIGTTITALVVAMTVTGEYRIPALQIALVHFLYNFLGVLLILGTPVLRTVPIRGAMWLGELVSHSRAWALVYLLGIFFLLPGVVLFVQQQLDARLPMPAEISSTVKDDQE